MLAKNDAVVYISVQDEKGVFRLKDSFLSIFIDI